MPLYEYQCRACGHRFEKIQKFSDPPIAACPSCGGEVEKLLSAPAIQFKGAGWYITDYARKGASDAASGSNASASSSAESTTTKGEAAKDSKGDKASSDATKSSAPSAGASASKSAKSD